ncbi:MAG: 17 kDa surface antigen [Alphaproteobacteria bacterium]|nr:17 kDa surface antigen [Alphaproteobacteria bacterium]
MKKLLLALTLVSVPALTGTAFAQSYQDQRRWEAAQARYQSETEIYQRERDRYTAARARSGGGPYRDDSYRNDNSNYNNAPAPNGGYNDPYATDYDASRYYREDPRYQERRLSAQDQVYRGSDGRYYCKRSDGTVGLIVGGVGGALLGNVIDGGRNRTAGTLIGGALGALLGRSVDQQNADVRCR